jgi:carbon monoxide dehydrogenase subunit G
MSMELDNSFSVPVQPDQAWDVLLDVKRIAPCMPGATVDDVDGDVVNGRIKVKVGPVSLTYRGTAKFTERDPDARMVVVEASGKETRGAGTASATVRASLAPAEAGTLVTMHTTMNVTGRPAQFGRGVIVEVGGKLVDQFAKNLANLIGGDTAAGSDAEAGASASASAGPGASAGAGVSAADVDDASAGAAGPDDGAQGSQGTQGGLGSPAGSVGVVEAAPQAAEAGTAAPVATAIAPEPAQSDQDSLNLVRLVGPAIAKRAVPVVLGAVAMAVLGRYFWRLRQRQDRAG